jgi:hypothetical protein
MKHNNRSMNTQFIDPAKAWALLCVYGFCRILSDQGDISIIIRS